MRPFAIERFYERSEFHAELMLSSSDCESIAVAGDYLGGGEPVVATMRV